MTLAEFSSILKLIGRRVKLYLVLDVFLGFSWFGVESLFLVILQGFLFSLGLLNSSQSSLPQWYPTDLASNLLMLVLFGVVRSVLYMTKQYTTVYSSQIFISEKRQLLMTGALLRKHDLASSQVVASFGETCAYAGNFITHSAQLIHSAVVSLLFVGLTLWIAPFETIVGISLLGITLYPIKSLSRKISIYGDNLMAEWGQMQGTLMNGMKNSFFLRLYRMSEKEAEKGVDSIRSFESNYKAYAVSSAVSLGLPQLLGILVLVIAAWIGNVYVGTKPLVLVSFFYLFIRLAQAVSQTLSAYSYMKLSYPGFKNLSAVIGRMDYSKYSKQETFQDNGEQGLRIDINSISANYQNGKKLFEDLSFSIYPNHFVLVQGPSGSGKSTLLKVVFGEHEAAEGSIILNGYPIVHGPSFASRVGYVGPEPFLLYGTVRDNLLYGNAHRVPDDHEIWETLDSVGLGSLIRGFKSQLDELLTEEVQMSTGQKQRLAFARALLRAPSILVLDEATANIDAETEDRLLQVLRQKKKQIGAFIISHKDSFNSLADHRIILG